MCQLNKPQWENNFHLLRLLAALEVLLAHGIAHLKIPVYDWVTEILWWFPGVPIFFVASGFLISQSYCNNKNLKQFFRNRALRIFPALWVCLLLSLVVVTLFGIADHFWTSGKFWRWFIAQLLAFSALAQITAGGMFSSFGTHDLNGALWTLSVELQFYLLLPLLFWGMRKVKSRLVYLSFVFCSSVIVYLVTIYYWSQGLVSNRVLLAYTSVFPHLFVFLIGIASYLYFERIKAFLVGRFVWWLMAYLLLRTVLWQSGYIGYWVIERNVLILLLTKIMLAGVVLSFVFSLPGLSQRVLGNNDISYGVYIYHMVVINIFVELNLTSSFGSLVTVIFCTCSVAYLSWRIVEKPALSLKIPRAFSGRSLVTRIE